MAKTKAATKAAKKTPGKKGSISNPLKPEELDDILSEGKPRDFIILKADIKDDFCNYTYEVTNVVGLGDKHKVESKVGTIKNELRDAMAAFNVHLAYMDDIFKHSGIEIETIRDVNDRNLRTHDLTELYRVTGFELSGSEEYLSIVLKGNKYVSAAFGRIEMKTPKVQIDELSSYKLHEDLFEIVAEAREQIALYKEGNYIPVATDDEEEEDPGATQLSIGDQIKNDKNKIDDGPSGDFSEMSNGAKKSVAGSDDDDFNNAKEPV